MILMAEHEIKNDKSWWLKPLVIGLIVIIALVIVLGFGLNYGFKFYNASLQHKTEALAQETTAPTTIQTATTVKETAATPETTAKTEETALTTTSAGETIETTVKTTENKPIPEGQIPAYGDSKDGVPENGTVIESDVGYDEVWGCSGGPGKFLGITFPGGEKRGFVILQLGPTEIGGAKVHYVITDLIPGANWQGNWPNYYRLVTEKDWMALVDLKVKEMMGHDNATDSLGCNTVDVAVAQAGKIIFQQTYEKQ